MNSGISQFLIVWSCGLDTKHPFGHCATIRIHRSERVAVLGRLVRALRSDSRSFAWQSIRVLHPAGLGIAHASAGIDHLSAYDKGQLRATVGLAMLDQ